MERYCISSSSIVQAGLQYKSRDELGDFQSYQDDYADDTQQLRARRVQNLDGLQLLCPTDCRQKSIPWIVSSFSFLEHSHALRCLLISCRLGALAEPRCHLSQGGVAQEAGKDSNQGTPPVW